MGRYDDMAAFLARVEPPEENKRTNRERLSAYAVDKIRQEYLGVPEEYLDYLREIGFGSLCGSTFMVYSGPGTPDEILGQGVFDWLNPNQRVLCFGDNFSGDLSGFLPEDGWTVVELWHDAGTVNQTNMTFSEYIRDKLELRLSGEG